MNEATRTQVMDIYAKTQPTAEDVGVLVRLIWDLDRTSLVERAAIEEATLLEREIKADKWTEKYPPPWKVERSPQTNGTIGWSVLDADDNEIVTVWDEEIAHLVAHSAQRREEK